MKENKKIKYKITLDDFFDIYYTNSIRLAIKGDSQLEDFLLSCALFEKNKTVNGSYCFDEWEMEPLPVLFSGNYVLLNNPVDGLDTIKEERARQLGIIVLDFYEVDCTKYLKGDWIFAPYGLEELKEKMLKSSKELEESRPGYAKKSAKEEEETETMEMRK